MSTTGEILTSMLGMGYDLVAGPHTNLLGYFAAFQVAQHDSDFPPNEVATWEECGHGITVDEAIVMAQQIALGQFSGPVPDWEEFAP